MSFQNRLFFLGLFLVLISVPASAENSDFHVLIEKGETLIKQGSYPAGIALLETILNKDPENPDVLSALLEACDAYSQKLMAENRYDLAQNYLKKMGELLKKIDSVPTRRFKSEDLKTQSRIKREVVEAKSFLLNPESKKVNLISLNVGREHYNEAVDYFNKRQYDIAESLLKKSIELDPSNAYAFELLGEIANLNQRLDEAERYYKQAFLIDSDPNLRAKYEKVIREKQIDQKQQQYEDEHFIIRYRRNESLEGSQIREYLKDAYRAISQDFGHYPKYKIPAVLYDREEYQTLMGAVPHWSGALFDGKIRLPIYLTEGMGTQEQINFYNAKGLNKLIYHELTHAFVLDLSQLKCPVWLNEGLAQYEENKISPIDLSLLRQAVRNNTLISVDELLFRDVSKMTDQQEAILYYLESFSLVSYILKDGRMYHMKQLLIELGKGTNFVQAYEKHFGRSFQEVTSNWQTELNKL